MSQHEECILLVKDTDTDDWMEVLELPSGELFRVAAGLGTATIVGSQHYIQLLSRARSYWPGAGRVRIEKTGNLDAFTGYIDLDGPKASEEYAFTITKEEVYDFCAAEFGREPTEHQYQQIIATLQDHMRPTWGIYTRAVVKSTPAWVEDSTKSPQ
jgi:hypothetical protein